MLNLDVGSNIIPFLSTHAENMFKFSRGLPVYGGFLGMMYLYLQLTVMIFVTYLA